MFRSCFKYCLITSLVLFSYSVSAQSVTHRGRIVNTDGGFPFQPVPRAIVVHTIITRLYNPSTDTTTEISRSYAAVTTDGSGRYSIVVGCDPTPNITYSVGRRVVMADGSLSPGGSATNYAGQFWCGTTFENGSYEISGLAFDNNIGNAGSTPPCPPQSVGRPVNVTNGNMWTTQSDYVLPGIGEALRITRTYNSVVQASGIFGYGWTSNYDAKLINGGDDLVQIDFGQGRIISFIRHGTTETYDSLAGDFHGQLTQVGVQYQLKLNDGSIYQFYIVGRLLYQRDRYGNQTTLSYDSNNSLASITDPTGRTLNVSSNANGTVAQISDDMSTVATYEYFPGTSLLKTVTYNDGSQYKFEYTTIDDKTYLTTVKDALDNILETHQYDSSGRATTSEKQGGVEKYTLDYSDPAFTAVTDALGRVTKYHFDSSKSRNLITKVEGLCGGCGGSASEVTQYFYDDNLNLIREFDARSNQTLYSHDVNGNRLTKTDATGTVTYTYNEFSQVLTRADQINGVTTNTYSAESYSRKLCMSE